MTQNHPQRAVGGVMDEPAAPAGEGPKVPRCPSAQALLLVMFRQHTLVATTRLRLARDPSRLVRGNPLQTPKSRPGRLQNPPSPALRGSDVSQVFPPSISVRSGPAASFAALRASGLGMCVATRGFMKYRTFRPSLRRSIALIDESSVMMRETF